MVLIHAICLQNILDNEIFEHSVIICKCQVSQRENGLPPPIYSQPQASSPTFSTKLTVRNLLDETIHETPLPTNSFPQHLKIVLELHPGTNPLAFSTCSCCPPTVASLRYVPRSTSRSILPLYVICTGEDGQFQAPPDEPHDISSALSRIDVACKLTQSLIAEKFVESGLGPRRTFQLAGPCCVFRSRLGVADARQLNGLELWYRLAREIVASFKDADTKYVAFLACTRYIGERFRPDMKTHADLIGITEGYTAFGGGGLALLGTACLYTWPETLAQLRDRFLDDMVVDKSELLDDSCYRGTRGGCFATTLGATIHELCHTFDLGHTDTGIMAHGFDEIHRALLEWQPDSNIDRFALRFGKPPNDGIFWTKSCLAILRFHKWFNDTNCDNTCQPSDLNYDCLAKMVKSKRGIRVIEIRRTCDDLVVKFWVFLERVLKFFHHIDLDDVNCTASEDLQVFVMDDAGNWLKKPL